MDQIKSVSIENLSVNVTTSKFAVCAPGPILPQNFVTQVEKNDCYFSRWSSHKIGKKNVFNAKHSKDWWIDANRLR